MGKINTHIIDKVQKLTVAGIPPDVADARYADIATEATATSAASQASTNASNVTVLQQGRTYRNLRSEGLTLDGTADQSAALQAVITNASAGEVLTLDDRATLRLDSQVTLSGKRLALRGFGKAKISKNAALNMPLLRVTSAPDVEIGGFAMAGGETVFANTSTTNHYAIEVVGSARANLHDLAISGFSRGINVDTSDYARVDNVSFDGLLTAIATWAQFHTTLRVNDCDYAHISRIAGRNCGSAVLVGTASEAGRVWAVDAINCWDNGVYVSEGHGWDVSGVVAVFTVALGGATPTGIKMRGSRNHAHHNRVNGYHTGMLASGYGTTAGYLDSEGYDGYGSKITDNVVRTTVGTAIILDLYSGTAPREFEASRNHVEGCGTNAATTSYGILVQGGTTAGSHRGARVIDNRIVNHAGGGPGVRLIGANATYPFIGPVVRGNEFRNLTVNSQAMAIRADYCTDGMFFGNRMENVTLAAYGLYITNGIDNIVTQNWKRGTVATVAAIRNESTSTGTRLYHNHNCTVSDVGTGTITTP